MRESEGKEGFPIFIGAASTNVAINSPLPFQMEGNTTCKEKRDIRGIRDIRDFGDIRDIGDFRDFRDIGDSRDIRDIRAIRDIRDFRDIRDIGDTRKQLAKREET